MIDFGKYTDLASAPFAFGAAALWVASAMVKTPETFAVDAITAHTGDAEIPSSGVIGQGFGTSTELNALGKALIKQSRLSAFAAGSAAVAAALQGFLAIMAHQKSN